MNIKNNFLAISLACLITNLTFTMNNNGSRNALDRMKQCTAELDTIEAGLQNGSITQSELMRNEIQAKMASATNQALRQINQDSRDSREEWKRAAAEKAKRNDEEFQKLLASMDASGKTADQMMEDFEKFCGN